MIQKFTKNISYMIHPFLCHSIAMCRVYRVVKKNIAQTLMHHHSATVCSRIMRVSPKCPGKITVYQSMQNVYQLVKYSFINSQYWIHVMSDVTLHVNMTLLTV